MGFLEASSAAALRVHCGHPSTPPLKQEVMIPPVDTTMWLSNPSDLPSCLDTLSDSAE